MLTGELDNFTYLLENIKFSSDSIAVWAWWLENPISSNYEHTWRVSGSYRNVNGTLVSNTVDSGVRPAIEVSKTNIDY